MLNPLITTTMRLQFGELNITPRVVARLHELDFTVPELEDAIADHKSPCDGEPSVYVGTYAKYNEARSAVFGWTFPPSTTTTSLSTSARLSTPTRKTRS